MGDEQHQAEDGQGKDGRRDERDRQAGPEREARANALGFDCAFGRQPVEVVQIVELGQLGHRARAVGRRDRFTLVEGPGFAARVHLAQPDSVSGPIRSPRQPTGRCVDRRRARSAPPP